VRPLGRRLGDDLVVLDQRVGQQLLAHRGQPARILDLEIDQAADPDVGDALEAQRGERPLHRLALGIENSLLGAHQDSRPHAATRSRQAWNGSPVMRS
jgi:hypothetical protein